MPPCCRLINRSTRRIDWKLTPGSAHGNIQMKPVRLMCHHPPPRPFRLRRHGYIATTIIPKFGQPAAQTRHLKHTPCLTLTTTNTTTASGSFACVHTSARAPPPVVTATVFFTPTFTPQHNLPPSDHPAPDPRKLQLGVTVRTLHSRLPTLLLSPLPSDILSPTITLHLFPSTHPHLPTVRGRIAYVAALWTAPVAWGSVPLVGNVRLTILSERMGGREGEEKLVVKWKTCGRARHRDGSGGVYRGEAGKGSKDPVDRIREFVQGTVRRDGEGGAIGTEQKPGIDDETSPAPGEEAFTGIFIFEFDAEGRIAKHVIEHTEEGGHWDKTARVVSVTDWLLGRFNGRGGRDSGDAGLALCDEYGPGAGRQKGKALVQ